MTDSLYIAWRYLRYHKGKTAILAVSMALIIYLPAGLQALVSQSARNLRSRAVSTPLVIGAKGSRQELVLNTLYFESDRPTTISMQDEEEVRESGLANAIPLYVRFRARNWPIVGTTLDYFDFRGLTVSKGRQLAILGECVLGAEVARDLDLAPGDSVISSPENAFDLAGVYPLKMNVVGVLKRAGTPDDRALFVDLKTAWVIEGLGHGHQDLSKPESSDLLLDKEDNVLTANAAVAQFTEITPENIGSFHFHGDPSQFPMTGIIAVPHDEKSATLLMGRYVNPNNQIQIARPIDVMDQLVATVMKVKSFIIAGAIIVGACAVSLTGLVFLLSLRLRRRELATMAKIGCSRFKIASIVSTEVVLVLGVALLIAAGLTTLTSSFGAEAIRWFVL